MSAPNATEVRKAMADLKAAQAVLETAGEAKLRSMATSAPEVPQTQAEVPARRTRKSADGNGSTIPPAAKKTQANAVLTTADLLADQYVTAQNAVDKVDGASKWQWAKQLSELLDTLADDNERSKTAAAIGARIGTELKGKPYSRQWVQNHVSAYKAFPECPQTPEDARKFRFICGGNQSKLVPASQQTDDSEDSGEGREASTPDPLRTFRNLCRKLRRDDFTEKDLIAAVREVYKESVA